MLLVLASAGTVWASPTYENVKIDVYRYDLTLNDNGQNRAVLKGFDEGYTYLTLVDVPGYVDYNGYKFRVDEIARRAFISNHNITRIEINYGVEQIGAEAFYNCTGVRSLRLASSVTAIGYSAFEGCTSMNHVRIATDVPPYLGNNAFKGTNSAIDCTTATNRGLEAFKADASWKAVFGARVSRNASSAYDFMVDNLAYVVKNGIPYTSSSGCVLAGGSPDAQGILTLARELDAGESINAPGTYRLVAVADSAFVDDPAIEGVAAHNTTALSIGEFAFGGCANLIAADVKVDSIKPYAFYGCPLLTMALIEEGVKYLGDFAFGECGLTEAMVPSTVNKMGYSPFHQCADLPMIEVAEANAYFASYEGCLYTKNHEWLLQVPGAWPHASTEGFFAPNLKYINDHAANGNHTIVTLVLPYGFKGINSAAFASCTRLKNVRLPSTVNYVSHLAFSGSDVQNLYVNLVEPLSLEHPLFDVTQMPNIKLYVPREGYGAYKTTTHWSKYDLQTGDLDHTEVWDYRDDMNCCWTVIDNVAHQNYEGESRDGHVRLVRGLNKMSIPSAVEIGDKEYNPVEIGRSAFEGITAPASMTVLNGGSVERIGKRAFYGSSINRFTFTRVEEIGDSAFMNTYSLGVDLDLPRLRHLGLRSFCNTGVRSFTTGAQFGGIEIAAFMGANSLTTVNMGASTSLRVIDQSAFRNCTSLTSCTLPGNVYLFNDYCFYGCDLSTRFNFPVGLKTIRANALRNTKLTDIELPYGITTIEEEALTCLARRIVLPSTITTVHSKFDEMAYLYLDELVINKVEPLRFSNGANVTFDNYGYPRGTLYVPVGSVDAYRGTTTWALYGGDKPISMGAYDFTGRDDGLKYTILPGAGECEMVHNPLVLNTPTMVVAGDDKWDGYGRAFVCTSVGNYCFKGSTSIITAYFSPTLKTIGFGAFQNSSLSNCIESFAGGSSTGYIPRTVSFIGGYAFNGCAGLRELFLPHIDRVDALTVGPQFFGGNANGFKVWVDYRRLGDFVTVNTWDAGKVYPHLRLDSEWQSFSCVKDINFSNTKIEAYVASRYDKSMNEVSLANVLKLPAETGAVVHGDADGTYYRLDYATGAAVGSIMEAVTMGSQTVESNNALSYFKLDANDPSFSKVVAGSETFYRGYAYLKLNTNVVGTTTTHLGTDLNGVGGPAQGDVNGDGFVNGSDVTALYSYLLDNVEPYGDPDVNGDGVVNGSDVTALYSILLEQ